MPPSQRSNMKRIGKKQGRRSSSSVVFTRTPTSWKERTNQSIHPSVKSEDTLIDIIYIYIYIHFYYVPDWLIGSFFFCIDGSQSQTIVSNQPGEAERVWRTFDQSHGRVHTGAGRQTDKKTDRSSPCCFSSLACSVFFSCPRKREECLAKWITMGRWWFIDWLIHSFINLSIHSLSLWFSFFYFFVVYRRAVCYLGAYWLLGAEPGASHKY